MPAPDLLINGVELMFLGMGIVFIFLFILVFALSLMSRISFYLDNSGEESQQAIPHQPHRKPENTALIAVIAAAVSRYRSAHN